MCLQYIKLKTKNEYGTRYGYVPCGKCVDCRKKLQNAWKFRINSEFLELKKKGWNVGFCTLTYNDRHLPKLSKKLFKNTTDYREISCFSRLDVREMIQNIRQYCKYHYKMVKGDNIRYFVSSEYGSITKRPHYHMIIAWPNRLSYEGMHKLIKKFWVDSKDESKGYVFPRDYRGDQETGCKSFEVVGDASKVLSYVSKYVCKDLDFLNEIEGIEFNENMRLFRDSQPFHLQSQSLGFEVIKNMSDEEKREVLIKGMSFQGDGELYQIPMYVKNKLVFDNYYIINDDGERLVKRKASEFFEKYRQEMFNEKAKFYTKFFAESTSSDYYKLRGVESETAKKFEQSIKHYMDVLGSYVVDNDRISNIFSNDLIGKLYLAYFGVKNSSCYAYESEETRDKDLCEQWMLRYRHPDEINNNDKVVISSQCYYALQNYCSLVYGCNQFVNLSKLRERENEEVRLARIRDFYNNVLSGKLI